MKRLKDIITEKLRINKNIKINQHNYQPKDIDELEKLINKLIKERGYKADLNDIDTSEITDMSDLFWSSKFNGDISEWDVSNVTNMKSMFDNCEFNGDISEWDVSNVTDMTRMFMDSEFNGDISDWDVSSVKNMDRMFNGTPLEKNPPKWYKK